MTARNQVAKQRCPPATTTEAEAQLARDQDAAIASAEAATAQDSRCEGIKQRKKRARKEEAVEHDLKRADSVLGPAIPETPATVSVTMAGYIFYGVTGVATFEKDAKPRARRRRRTKSDVSGLQAEDPTEMDRRVYLSIFQAGVKRRHQVLGLKRAGLLSFCTKELADRDDTRNRRDSW